MPLLIKKGLVYLLKVGGKNFRCPLMFRRALYYVHIKYQRCEMRRKIVSSSYVWKMAPRDHQLFCYQKVAAKVIQIKSYRRFFL